MRYVVVLEKSRTGVGAYVPDLPGCIAVGEDRDDTLRLIREAIGFHLEGLRDAGEPTPVADTQLEVIEVETV